MLAGVFTFFEEGRGPAFLRWGQGGHFFIAAAFMLFANFVLKTSRPTEMYLDVPDKDKEAQPEPEPEPEAQPEAAAVTDWAEKQGAVCPPAPQPEPEPEQQPQRG